MIWNEEMECMGPEERKELQLKRLKEAVKRAEEVPFYKEQYDKLGLSADSIETLEDIEKFPFTTKDDLRSCYPFKLVAADPEDIVEIHASSGTTGTATVTCYTENDLDIWGETLQGLLEWQMVRKKTKFKTVMDTDYLPVVLE